MLHLTTHKRGEISACMAEYITLARRVPLYIRIAEHGGQNNCRNAFPDGTCNRVDSSRLYARVDFNFMGITVGRYRIV